MGKHPIVLTAVVAMLASATASWAQAPGAGAAVQGFNVTLLISQLSIYLPEEATQRMYGGRGGSAGGQQGQAGQQGAAAQGQAQGGQQGGLRRFQINFTRDPKLFLTRDQIARVIPIMTALKDNPMPTPSKAKQVQADVDAILTAAQKAEYAQFQKEVQKLIQSFRQQMSANGAGSGAAAGALGGGQDAGQGAQAGGTGRAGGAGQGGAQLTVLQRRQRQVEAFIKVLQERQSQVGA
jgi:hypothetical protein